MGKCFSTALDEIRKEFELVLARVCYLPYHGVRILMSNVCGQLRNRLKLEEKEGGKGTMRGVSRIKV